MAKKLRYEQTTSFLKGQASKLFKQVFDEKTPMVVQHHGKALVVILAADEYERIAKRKLNVTLYDNAQQ
ncbi:MAG: type II toxin-antitoxin system Phd/YefM family antitoxin [Tannerellaceae bacterium]